MKKLMLSLSFVAFAGTAQAQAIDCKTLPNCADLGYTDKAADCPTNSNEEKQVLLCPFDKTRGKCIHEAAVGQIGYFSKTPGNGWLLCNGASHARATYPDLAKFLDTQFCNSTYHYSGSCPSTDTTFAVPNYQGYFLRVYGTPNLNMGKASSGSITTPQKEGLPDITGEGGYMDNFSNDKYKTRLDNIKGAFYLSTSGAGTYYGAKEVDNDNPLLNFKASKSNTIYGSSTGVTPPNIAVYAYIYAGRVVK